MTETETEIETARIEEVFRLQGALETARLTFDGYDASGPNPVHTVVSFHYDGPPEYVQDDFILDLDSDDDVWTAVRDCLFGLPPEILIASDGRIYRRAAYYTSSGETECPLASFDPETGSDGRDLPVTETACPLCGESKGEPHGFIYLGDGWAEVVYVSVGYVRGMDPEGEA